MHADLIFCLLGWIALAAGSWMGAKGERGLWIFGASLALVFFILALVTNPLVTG